MKTKKLVTILAVAGLIFLFAACSEEANSIDDTIAITDTEKCVELGIASDDTCSFTGILTEAEIEGLLEMREEEKLAQDVYLYFYDLYKTPIFKNISKIKP